MKAPDKRRKKKKTQKRFIYSNLSIALLLLLIIFLSYEVSGLQKKRNISEAKRSEAEIEYNRYLEDKESLQSEIKDLKTEEGKEKIIRERFNVVKEGEGVIYVVEDDPAIGSSLILENNKETKKTGFFARFLDFLKP